ncbi:CHAT domain-containing protein [Saccharothrix sp. S26]|uniref:CHAT domain-containing protein n=1 Tax=Saccharothrix sp. S26 TaxID=2907215 RepID=UPI001F43B262|nr:CHAT domain-containing protein [Saccharothrix sp. S26]MCE6994978.1 CHAT domain-containing protein [Saccharothrix sp. S26]
MRDVIPLDERIARWRQTGDPTDVLGPDALAQAARLALPAVDGDVGPEVVTTLAALHWIRYSALRPEFAGADLDAVLTLCGPLAAHAPDAVPQPVLEWREQNPEAPVLSFDEVGGFYATVIARGGLVTRHPELVDLGVRACRAALRSTEGPDVTVHRYNLLLLLCARHERGGAVADLDEAVEVGRAALAPADHPLVPAVGLNLGLALHTRFEILGREADLDEATGLLRPARTVPLEDDERLRYLFALGTTLALRGERGGPPAELDECVEVAREVLTACPEGHPDHPVALLLLAEALKIRFVRTGEAADVADIDESVRLTARLLSADPEEAAPVPLLKHIGGLVLRLLHARAYGTADEGDLAEATRLAAAADAAVPEGHPLRHEVDQALGLVRRAAHDDYPAAERAARAALSAEGAEPARRVTAVFALADVLTARYGQTGDTAVLEEATRLLREVVAEADHHVLMAARLKLAEVAREWFRLSGADRDLDAAVEAAREAVRTGIPDQVLRAEHLWHHANLLRQRFERTGRRGDLDERIAVLRAIAPLAVDDADRASHLHQLAAACTARFQLTGEPADLDRAVIAVDRAAALLPADHAGAPRVWTTGAVVRQLRFVIAGDPDDVAEAVRLGRAAVDRTPSDVPHRADALNALAVSLGSAAKAARDPAGLAEAVDVSREAMAVAGGRRVTASLTVSELLIERYLLTGAAGDLAEAAAALRSALPAATGHERGSLLNNLALVVHQQVQHHGASADLDEAVEEILREAGQALAAMPSGHVDALALTAKTAALRSGRYELRRDPTDLERAIGDLRAAVAGATGAHPGLAECRLHLGLALTLRFAHHFVAADGEEAVAVLREGMTQAAPGDVRVALRLQLALALLSRAQWSPSPEARDEAVELLRAAKDDFGPGTSGHLAVRLHLGRALQLRYNETGDPAVLAEAIEATRTGVRTTAPDHAQHATLLVLLGTLLTQWFERTDDPAVIDEAVDAHRRAAATTTAGTGLTAAALSELANSLRVRYLRRSDPGDLEEAVAVARRALALPGLQPPERASASAALGNTLLVRAQHTGDLADFTAAVDLGRGAVGELPGGHFLMPLHLMGLGTALWARYERAGAITDLHEGIDVMRAAADRSEDSALRSIMLTNLGNALCARARHLGSTADVDEAVVVARAAVDTASEATAPTCLLNLAVALQIRFLERHDPADLDAAIEAASESVRRCPPDHPLQGQLLSSLAMMRFSRGQARSGGDDLDRAVDLLREAVAITDPAHASLPMHRLNLASVLRARYDRRGGADDVTEAVEQSRQAADTIPADDPRRASAWLTLGLVLGLRHDRHRVATDYDDAVTACRAAVESPSATPVVRASAALAWAFLAARHADWPSAVEGFGVAAALLPQAVWHGVERGARERRLDRWEGVASAGAAAALEAGEVELAVELLERGRSVLWSQALQTRDDASVLRARDPALHDRLRSVAAEMAAADAPVGLTPALPTGLPPDAARRDRDRRIRLAQEWDRLLARARALPGLEHLLRVPPLATLRDGLPDGPVVLVNVDDVRCDALVVRREGPVEHIPLPDLTASETSRRATAYLRALRVLGRPAVPGDLTRTGAKQTLHVTLEWLWDVVAGPVLDHLGLHDGERVWWCPTGLLTLLPLHAAGYHDPADTPAGRTVLDRVVSSYTPTLRALARARQADAPATADRRLLAVSLPEPPPGEVALSPLPGARAEAEFFARALPGAHTLRVGEAATHAAVTEDLRTHAYAHFACHGAQDLRDPSTGALYLWDKPLTVLDVAGLDLAHAELAYLSACHTAVGGATLPDEAIHLAAALQLAGYRHVVATLWTVADRTAVDVATSVYSALVDGDGLDLADTARVLHRTVRALRDADPRDPTRWAPYVHSGA